MEKILSKNELKELFDISKVNVYKNEEDIIIEMICQYVQLEKNPDYNDSFSIKSLIYKIEKLLEKNNMNHIDIWESIKTELTLRNNDYKNPIEESVNKVVSNSQISCISEEEYYEKTTKHIRDYIKNINMNIAMDKYNKKDLLKAKKSILYASSLIDHDSIEDMYYDEVRSFMNNYELRETYYNAIYHLMFEPNMDKTITTEDKKRILETRSFNNANFFEKNELLRIIYLEQEKKKKKRRNNYIMEQKWI